MTTSYLECDHKWREQFSELFKAVFWSCDFCDLRTWRAPWSYREVIGCIGITAIYRSAAEGRLRAGEPLLEREQFAAQLALFAMEPYQFVRALQCGIRWVTPTADRPLIDAIVNGRVIT